MDLKLTTIFHSSFPKCGTAISITVKFFFSFCVPNQVCNGRDLMYKTINSFFDFQFSIYRSLNYTLYNQIESAASNEIYQNIPAIDSTVTYKIELLGTDSSSRNAT